MKKATFGWPSFWAERNSMNQALSVVELKRIPRCASKQELGNRRETMDSQVHASNSLQLLSTLLVETLINHDKRLASVRPEPVEGLRQAQPERQGVMHKETSTMTVGQVHRGEKKRLLALLNHQSGMSLF
ncbi:MAG: hypothetical protein KGL73_01570 [Burkholderiales bacterium]|nr:hypothetical protein [Burkholderiales bacterium]